MRELNVSHVGNTRFRIEVRGHELFVDQPASGDGLDTAPTPTELFVASLAACGAFYGRTYLARRGLPDRVDVKARWNIVRAPDRVGEVTLVVDAPGVPPERREVFQKVIESCLVHNTLHHGCGVNLVVEEPGRDEQAI